jgi:hypothetical protein
MSIGTMLLIAAAVLAGGSLVSRIFREGLEARDELGHLPFTAIGAATPGPICVRGRTRALGPPLVAPVSGRLALFFEVVATVDCPRTTGGRSRSLTHRRIGATSFEVDDGSGRVVVNIPPDGPPVGEGEPEVLTSLPAIRREQDRWRGRIDLEQLFGRQEFRQYLGYPMSVVERIVAVDDVITVGGLAARQVHSAGTREGLRDPPTSLVFEATREQPLVLVIARYDALPPAAHRA